MIGFLGQSAECGLGRVATTWNLTEPCPDNSSTVAVARGFEGLGFRFESGDGLDPVDSARELAGLLDFQSIQGRPGRSGRQQIRSIFAVSQTERVAQFVRGHARNRLIDASLDRSETRGLLHERGPVTQPYAVDGELMDIIDMQTRSRS